MSKTQTIQPPLHSSFFTNQLKSLSPHTSPCLVNSCQNSTFFSGEIFVSATLAFANFSYATLKFDISPLPLLAKVKCQILEWHKQNWQKLEWQKQNFPFSLSSKLLQYHQSFLPSLSNPSNFSENSLASSISQSECV